jgi:hypothetical protein
MDTPKKTSRVVNAILSTVRGPGFLFGISAMLLLAAIPAEATLLRGYLQQNITTETSPVVQNHAAVHPPHLTPSAPSASAEDVTRYGASIGTTGGVQSDNGLKEPQSIRRLNGINGMIAANSFPASFEGAWRCVTVVIDSAIPTVRVGERIESQVAFLPQNDGRIVAHWNQTGWGETAEAINSVSNVEANMERTNYYFERDRSTGWAARSRDHYLQISQNKIAADSDVDQFVGGQFLGQYRTKSMLFRLESNLALAPQ